MPAPHQSDSAALSGMLMLRPSALCERARDLRERSSRCRDLAGDSVTEQGRTALQSLADDFSDEADKIEDDLARLRSLLLESEQDEFARH